MLCKSYLFIAVLLFFLFLFTVFLLFVSLLLFLLVLLWFGYDSRCCCSSTMTVAMSARSVENSDLMKK